MVWIIIILMLIGACTSDIGRASIIFGVLSLGCYLLSLLSGWAWLLVLAKVFLGLVIIVVVLGIISLVAG